MRYLFRGQRRQTGEPIEGRVTAPTEAAAYRILGDDGIVVASLKPEPSALGETARADTESEFARALERALDDAGFGIRFDYLTGRYQGKSVSLLDQDKIRKRVMKLVDEADVETVGGEENRQEVRRQLAQLLEKVLRNRQSLSAERSGQSPALESRVDHLTQALERIEKAMASMAIAVRRAGQDQSRRPVPGQTAHDKTHEEVLIEIFQNNLELRRGLKEPVSQPATGGGQAAGRLS